MQANLLRGEIVAAGKTVASVAEEIGMKTKTMYNKMNGQSQFTVDEAESLCAVLHITDPAKKCSIFLS